MLVEMTRNARVKPPYKKQPKFLYHGKLIYNEKKFRYEVIDLEDDELLGVLDEWEFRHTPDQYKRNFIAVFLDRLWWGRIIIDVDETGILKEGV